MTYKKPRGRPAVLKNSSILNINLDEKTKEKARDIGDGNLSAGIRIAVAKYKIKDKKDDRQHDCRQKYSDGLDVCRLLPKELANENGGGFGYVCIWRMPRDGSDSSRRCTVAEFLSRHENAGGSWYIDGGWGGPPGAIRVDWDESANAWRNRGFPPWD